MEDKKTICLALPQSFDVYFLMSFFVLLFTSQLLLSISYHVTTRGSLMCSNLLTHRRSVNLHIHCYCYGVTHGPDIETIHPSGFFGKLNHRVIQFRLSANIPHVHICDMIKGNESDVTDIDFEL